MRYLLLIIVTILSGCSQMDINSYKDESPKLVLENYLNGNIKGYGIVQDRSKKVTRRFDFSGHASWQGSKGVFDEKIVYTNGKVETRHWLFTKVADNRYEATTNDVIGKAIITVAGNAMNWKYDMNIDVDGSIYKINFDDWMFLLDEKRLMNRNYFKKFGFNVGELTLYMEKQD